MKTEKPTLEEVERVLGVKLPEAPEGHTWDHRINAKGRKGDLFLNTDGDWLECCHDLFYSLLLTSVRTPATRTQTSSW